MSEMGYNFRETIIEINDIFTQLKILTSDELRNRVDEIKKVINRSEDKAGILNSFLPEVYAIVKETSRRISQGEIVVTANANDRQLAEKFDFVTIKDEKAIYINRWEVEGIDQIWNMVHYDEQLLGGIHLHYGSAIEMATGEGKTLVATLPVFLNALSGEGVHLMTVNDYLSKRDCQLTRPLYMFYGLSVDCIDFYERNDYEGNKYGRKKAYASDITFGSNSTFVFDYLFDHLAIDPRDCVQANHNFAIIDELDSILIDEAEVPHIVAGGMEYYDGDIYQEYIGIVKELVDIEDSNYFFANRLLHKAEFTPAGIDWLSQKLRVKDLFKYTRTYEVDDFDTLSMEIKTQVLQNIRIQNVLTQLLNALTVYEKDVDYLVTGNKIKIIDPNTGRIKERSRWRHGLHTAIEVKESVNILGDSDGMAVISLKNYFKFYSKIAGMSGTITTVREELKSVYGLNSEIIPTHLPVVRVDFPLRIFKTRDAKDKEIITQILANHRIGRPSLVGTVSLKRANEIEKHLIEMDLKFNRLDARTTKDEAMTVAKAGQGNTITLSTSVAGRGTDIKPSEDALRNGGLSIIGCDLFGSIRTDLQLKGRAGRQGNPGSSTFYASLEDDILSYLSTDERSNLNHIVTQIEADEVSCEEIEAFFKLAQTNREEIHRKRRTETTRTDDIVAPHRTIFYTQRNKVLFDAKYASTLVDDIITREGTDLAFTQMNTLLPDLYAPTKALVTRSKKNNQVRRKIYVPYSENKQPFAIGLDVDLLLSSEEYFISEFKRQNVLQVYDKFWKDFVVYMMKNLDSKELLELSDRYSKMMTSINAIIIQRMTMTVPTFTIFDTIESEIEKKDSKEHISNNRMSKHIVKEEELCPCGSGLLYHECHGKCGIQTPRRRH